MTSSFPDVSGGKSGPTATGVTLGKVATGIPGLEDILHGGLPEGRLTAVAGGPGCGKTLFGLQTLFNQTRSTGQPSLFVTFEEPIDRLRQNLASLEWGRQAFYDGLITFIDAKLPVDATHAGTFDMSGLLAVLSHYISETGASTIVFDSIDVLLATLPDSSLDRQELTRIGDWVNAQGVSALITVRDFGISDRDQQRAEFLSYLTDCVIKLEATMHETNLSRTLRVAKYRGSSFAGNTFPMVISSAGIEVIASKNKRLSYPTYAERLSTGVLALDSILSGGLMRGTSILVSGAPGTAKTSLAASMLAAACTNGKNATFVSFDESDTQIVANMKSIGIDLSEHVRSGRLQMISLRSAASSPEEHFLTIRDAIDEHDTACLAIDPLSALVKSSYPFNELISECLLDHTKSRGITTICTSLLDKLSDNTELSASHVSTIADTWVHLSYMPLGGERNRSLTIIKSRGTHHSNQVRELIIGEAGLDLLEVYSADGAVLMGSARAQKENADLHSERLTALEFKQRRFAVERELSLLEESERKAASELGWTRRELALLQEAEEARLVERRQTAQDRVSFRSRSDRFGQSRGER